MKEITALLPVSPSVFSPEISTVSIPDFTSSILKKDVEDWLNPAT